MKKIPTLFARDAYDMSRVLNAPNLDCVWVFDGKGVATRKYDGTCVALDGYGHWYARREVKRTQALPLNFEEVAFDEVTGKRVGWVPIAQSSFARYHAEALANCPDDAVAPLTPGTYELIGPKVNGNPEGVSDHLLISHARAQKLANVPRDYDGLRIFLGDPWFRYEGIVWHHPDGRMAKIKRRDFGLRPVTAS